MTAAKIRAATTTSFCHLTNKLIIWSELIQTGPCSGSALNIFHAYFSLCTDHTWTFMCRCVKSLVNIVWTDTILLELQLPCQQWRMLWRQSHKVGVYRGKTPAFQSKPHWEHVPERLIWLECLFIMDSCLYLNCVGVNWANDTFTWPWLCRLFVHAAQFISAVLTLLCCVLDYLCDSICNHPISVFLHKLVKDRMKTKLLESVPILLWHENSNSLQLWYRTLWTAVSITADEWSRFGNSEPKGSLCRRGWWMLWTLEHGLGERIKNYEACYSLWMLKTQGAC